MAIASSATKWDTEPTSAPPGTTRRTSRRWSGRNNLMPRVETGSRACVYWRWGGGANGLELEDVDGDYDISNLVIDETMDDVEVFMKMLEGVVGKPENRSEDVSIDCISVGCR